MNTKNMTQEEISTFADGEATPSQTDAALAALSATDSVARQQWTTLHRIGDALRSNELALDMSPDFMRRFSARLEQEPTIIAPSLVPAAVKPLGRRLVVPGVLAAAAAAFALLGAPQLMVASRSPSVLPSHGSAMLASASGVSRPARQPIAGQGELLRDPDIDQYLLAHQRFSPSLYSTAQFARSPAFATSDK